MWDFERQRLAIANRQAGKCDTTYAKVRFRVIQNVLSYNA